MSQAYSKHFPYIVPEATQQPYEVVPIIFFFFHFANTEAQRC